MEDFSNKFKNIPIKCQDFIGFSFCGVHSSQLNIKRTSSGNRFEENLFPENEDITKEVPNGNGLYYWQTNFREKKIDIPFAYDSMTEVDFRKIKQVFSPKNYGQLFFDETPYKYYMAKVTSNLSLKYICFDEEDKISSPEKKYKRIYKGEGTISFICYFPYAISRFKYLTDYQNNSLFFNNGSDNNTDEWKCSSGILEEQGNYDKPGKEILIYNPGDLETDFIADYYFTLPEDKDENFIYPIKGIACGNNSLTFIENGINIVKGDSGIRINSKTQLIEGLNASKEPTGNIYNKFIKSGTFFKLPITTDEEVKFISGYYTENDYECNKLEYNYLYY